MIRSTMSVAQKLELLEKVVSLGALGVVALDRDYRYLMWNPEMERIAGLTAIEVLGKRALELFPFLQEIGEDKVFEKAFGGDQSSSRGRAYTIEGTQRSGYFDAEYWPIATDDGEVTCIVGIIRDVTIAREAEQQVREIEQRFKNMADVAPVLLWMSRTDGMCTFFNQTWLDFTGRTLEQEWGIGWAEGVHFEDVAYCMDSYMDAFSRREVFEIEYRLARHDGAFRWILDRGTPRYLPDGSFAGYIGSCVDITRMKELELELRKAVEVRDDFLAIASHELRTPLTALSLQLQILRRSIADLPDSDARKRSSTSVETAFGKAKHLDAMVGVLLDVSRLSRGPMHLDRSDVELGAIVAEVLERMGVAARDAGCELRFVPGPPARGSWDAIRISQVLANLLTNAITYAARAPIEISTRILSGVAELTVTDHGPGIAPEHQPLLFERFTRFVPTHNYSGFGLGLWIAREIVQAHGGTIRVASATGHGASFVVALPVS